MDNAESKTGNNILPSDDLKMIRGISRREFVKYSAGVAACAYLGVLTGCGSGSSAADYPISNTVVTTAQQVLSFNWPEKILIPNSGTGLCPTELPLISQYSKYGYGDYTLGAGLQIEKRYDLMSPLYTNPAPVRVKQLASFFTMTDIHITDKESPNQLIYIQQYDSQFGGPGTSIYSPVMMYTTHVLDAAMQTVNALHKTTPFDFGISLGDVCNSAQYNELRWYIDVIDGKIITPSSGAHLGADSIDYQKRYKAAGLNKDISWYQTLGNHDHFCIGSFPIDADPTVNIRAAYTSANIWAIGDVLAPNSISTFPCLFDTFASLQQKTLYAGTIDGTSPTGAIKDAGTFAAVTPPPTITADPNRRPLHRTDWIQEFFKTTSNPVGHGLNLVDRSLGDGFACYSFLPKSEIPLKVIVLDDTQSDTDGSHDIHGHGFLDATRWNWLRAELASGQAANQLMIIAAHIPIAVANVGSEVEWWESEHDPNATEQNAVTLAELVAELQSNPNLLMWMSGHRHFNTIKGFTPPPGGAPENAFWQVETSSLRDSPQQFRTFAIYLNSDYTISIVTTNVDPAVTPNTPAAKSRTYSIAAQQIVQTNLLANAQNTPLPIESMDPTRAHDNTTDLTIKFNVVPGVPYCASYNAELFKQLSPTMVNVLKAQFPVSA